MYEYLQKMYFVLTLLFITSNVIGEEDLSYSVFRNEEVVEETHNKSQITTESDSYRILVKDQYLPVLHKNIFNITHKLNQLMIVSCNVSELRQDLEEAIPPLQHLSITGNDLKVIKSGIFNNLEVKVLDLTNNNIEEIETDAFDNNRALNEIHLQKNKIKKIDPDWFKNSPNLNVVNLNLNEIVFIPAYALQNIAKSNTAIISINSNKIKEVDSKAFDGIKDVGMLDLSNNFIEVIPEELFANTQVFFLNLSTNRIRDYPRDELFTNVQSINFDNNDFNQFHIDCHEH